MESSHFYKNLGSNLKSGFFKGVGFGLGLTATSLFAAAAAMKVFQPGESLSSSSMNRNFTIAAPEGAILAFFLDSCPEGWAPADGTNGTPDLRGRFVRGRDNVGTGAAGNDPSGSRSIGDAQSDAFQGHYHDVSSGNLNFQTTGGGGGNLTTGGGSGGISPLTGSPSSDGTNGTPRTSSETRPKNIALTYCMRKN